MSRSTTAAPGPFVGLLRGAGYLIRGLGVWSRRPNLMLLGAIPALVVSALLLAGLVVLALNADSLATTLTPFADAWAEGSRAAVRLLVAVGLLAGGIGLAVLAFTGLTLAVGAPAYEKISGAVEDSCGGVPGEVQRPIGVQIGRAVADGLRLVGIAVVMGLLVLVIGLIPVIGAVAGPVVAAIVGGRAIATELTGTPGDARGMTLSQRRALLKEYRWTALGFGMACYLAFLVPLGAVLATPAAVAGATLLLRDLRGEPTS